MLPPCPVQVWRHSEGGGWQQDGPALTGHSDWVRDVAWAPNLGLPANTLASAGQDGRVFTWAEQAGGGWERTLLQDFQARPRAVMCLSRVHPKVGTSERAEQAGGGWERMLPQDL